MKVRINHYRPGHPKFKPYLKELARAGLRLTRDKKHPIWSTKCNGITKVTLTKVTSIKDEAEAAIVATGYSFCEPRDFFVKKEGVRRARERADKMMAKLTG